MFDKAIGALRDGLQLSMRSCDESLRGALASALRLLLHRTRLPGGDKPPHADQSLECSRFRDVDRHPACVTLGRVGSRTCCGHPSNSDATRLRRNVALTSAPSTGSMSKRGLPEV